jgi:hypothetical protein
MKPSNDHELAIAKAVDALALEGKLDHSAIEKITRSLDFLMSRTDSRFLVGYVQWRRDHPISVKRDETAGSH